MAYAFHLETWYALEVTWFYGMATDQPDIEDDQFEAAVEQTGLSYEDAVAALVRPHLSKLGFPSDGWQILTLTDDYVCYEGFALRHLYGKEFIVFEADTLFTWAENLPESKTMHFTRGHERLAKVMRFEELGPVDMVLMERLEQEEDGEEEEESA